MNKNDIRTTDFDLAKLFLGKCEKERIIADVFDFFEFDCLERCNINPTELDNKIKEFKNADCNNPEIPAEIISIIKNNKNISKKKHKKTGAIPCLFIIFLTILILFAVVYRYNSEELLQFAL